MERNYNLRHLSFLLPRLQKRVQVRDSDLQIDLTCLNGYSTADVLPVNSGVMRHVKDFKDLKLAMKEASHTFQLMKKIGCELHEVYDEFIHSQL